MYIRLLLGCLVFAARLLPTADCAGDESEDYRVLKFRVAADGDALLVPVRFGERDFDFVLDTGSTDSIFDACFRQKMGPPIRRSLAHTPAGDYWYETFRAPAATIAGRPLSGVYEVSCESLSLFQATFGHEMYGVLGIDFLAGRCVRINFDAGELAILESVPVGSGEPVPLSYSREYGVRALVEVEGAGRLSFAIDTGYIGCGDIEKSVLERLIRDRYATAKPDTLVATLQSEELTAQPRACVGRMSLGGFDHRGLVFTGATRNALGLLYLRRYLVTFDFRRMKMYLKPGARLNEPYRSDLSGLGVWRPEGRTTIASVEKGSVAERAGVELGDVIEAIGERHAGEMSLHEIRELFTLSGTHTLRIARGDRKLDARLVLEESRTCEELRPNGESKSAK
jgi:hypothetical protein